MTTESIGHLRIAARSGIGLRLTGGTRSSNGLDSPQHRTTRLLRRGAGSLVVCSLLVACSSGDDASGTTADPGATSTEVTATTAPTTSSTIPPATAPAPTEPVAPTVVELPEPDGAALLQRALDDAAAAGYHFLSTVTVGSTVALTAEGDRVGDATRMTVTSNGSSVEWVITPGGSWAAQGGNWEELEETAPTSDPLAPLRSPAAVVVTAYDESTTTLAATYPAAAFGLSGDGSIDVILQIGGAALNSLGYETSDGTTTTVVRTDLGPLTDTSPVTVPAT